MFGIFSSHGEGALLSITNGGQDARSLRETVDSLPYWYRTNWLWFIVEKCVYIFSLLPTSGCDPARSQKFQGANSIRVSTFKYL